MKYEKINQTTENARREGYSIIVTLKKAVDGKSYQIKASARDSKGNPVKNSTRIKYFSNAEQIKSKTQQVIALVNAVIPKDTGLAHRSIVSGLDETNAMVIAYRAIAESDAEISPTWNAEYRKNQLTYFERHILPRISHFADPEMPFLSSDREQLFADIYDEIRENGHSKGNKRIMQRTARNHLSDAEVIYGAIRREDPSLPLLKLGNRRATRSVQREMMKSLPAELRNRFAQALRERAGSEPTLVFGAVLMWDGGLRTAEAAAAIYSIDIRSHDGSESKVSMYVEWQEKDGLRCPKLKTGNGYRVVPLSFWGASLLSQCADAMPVSDSEEHARDPPPAPLRARELSAWVKSLLIECGLTVEFLERAEADQSKKPDVDDQGNPIWDITAYVLRRDRCSIWRNICGLTQSECDYLLGHAIRLSKHAREDLRLPEAQLRLAEKLERFVADPQLSKHPYYQPIAVFHGTDIDVIPFEAIQIVNTTGKPLRVELSLDAKIAGEAIAVTIPTNSIAREPHRRSKRTHGVRASEPIIGTCQIVR